ncbi:nuclear transport factor 2 family protein [Pseudonocardia sp. NPDC049154]|uniref:nuclear transport factor 2 family protein n=1 Tax=Pseudonocardia sp. NPDC049154 TaxID=3155501 RepID=UPI0033EB6623
MTLVDAPEAVATYLRAKTDTDVGTIVGCFTPDAVVHDEGRDHVGTAEIRAWAEGVAAAYTLTRTVRSVRGVGAATVVAVEIAGDFPGSPVLLHHHFTLADGSLAALTICP